MVTATQARNRRRSPSWVLTIQLSFVILFVLKSVPRLARHSRQRIPIQNLFINSPTTAASKFL
jgi:hypothetical protein